jgi:hypothetical protein
MLLVADVTGDYVAKHKTPISEVTHNRIRARHKAWSGKHAKAKLAAVRLEKELGRPLRRGELKVPSIEAVLQTGERSILEWMIKSSEKEERDRRGKTELDELRLEDANGPNEGGSRSMSF